MDAATLVMDCLISSVPVAGGEEAYQSALRSETYGHTERRHDGVDERGGGWHPIPFGWELKECQTGSET